MDEKMPTMQGSAKFGFPEAELLIKVSDMRSFVGNEINELHRLRDELRSILHGGETYDGRNYRGDKHTFWRSDWIEKTRRDAMMDRLARAATAV